MLLKWSSDKETLILKQVYGSDMFFFLWDMLVKILQ